MCDPVRQRGCRLLLMADTSRQRIRTPNRMSAIYICTWNVMLGAKHTYGTTTPAPDYENARCILLWGADPRATIPIAAQRISRARGRGAKLIVIDPRRHILRAVRIAGCG